MKITVCICTFKRNPLLKRLLKSLVDIELQSLAGHDIDILVINNFPNPDTPELCQQAASELSLPLRCIEEARPGLVNARNRAVAEALAANADAIAFLDDDDLPDRDWLAQLVAVYSDAGADIVAGNRRFADPPPWSEGAAERRERKSAEKQVGSGRIPRGAATCNVLIGRNILLELSAQETVFRSAFTLSGGEDKDFFLRAARQGAKIVFAPQSFVTQFNEELRYTLSGCYRRGFKAGCSKMNITLCHDNFRKAFSLAVNSSLKLLGALLVLPLVVFNRRRRLAQCYRIGRAAGICYYFVTGKSIKYYYHEGS